METTSKFPESGAPQDGPAACRNKNPTRTERRMLREAARALLVRVVALIESIPDEPDPAGPQRWGTPFALNQLARTLQILQQILLAAAKPRTAAPRAPGTAWPRVDEDDDDDWDEELNSFNSVQPAANDIQLKQDQWSLSHFTAAQ